MYWHKSGDGLGRSNMLELSSLRPQHSFLCRQCVVIVVFFLFLSFPLPLRIS